MARGIGIQIARGRSGRPTGFVITKEGQTIGRAGIVPGAASVRLRGPVVPNLPVQPKEVLGEEVEEIGEMDESPIISPKPAPTMSSLKKPPSPQVPVQASEEPEGEEGEEDGLSLKERMKRKIQADLNRRKPR